MSINYISKIKILFTCVPSVIKNLLLKKKHIKKRLLKYIGENKESVKKLFTDCIIFIKKFIKQNS